MLMEQTTSIRVVTEADIDTGIAFAQQFYPNRNIASMRHWLEWLIHNKDRCVLIGDHTVGCAQFYWRYGTEPRARLDFLASKPGTVGSLEPLRMLRMMVDWAKFKGARGSFLLDADTGVDFGPFAARLGGKEVTTTYWTLPLE